MAKTGLNFGEKLQIVDKSYRVITDALKLDDVFGKLTFRSIEGAELIYEDDRSQRTFSLSWICQNRKSLTLVSTTVKRWS